MEIILLIVLSGLYVGAARYLAMLFSLGSRTYRKVLSNGSELLRCDPNATSMYNSISVN